MNTLLTRGPAMLVGLFVPVLAATASPDAGPGDEGMPIDLVATMRLAGSASDDVALARERVREAQARFEQSRARFLPWLEPAAVYRRHEGATQDVAGRVSDVSKQSATAGVGVGLAADWGGAYYAALAARQQEKAARAAAEVSAQDALHAAIAAYFRLAGAQGTETALRDAVRVADDYAGQVRRAVDAGLAFRGDLFRADMQAERNRAMLRRAAGQAAVASAGLARVLRLPPEVPLRARAEDLAPMSIVETNVAASELAATAVAERPELGRVAAARAAATEERRGLQYAPWIPSLGAHAAPGYLDGGADGTWSGWDDAQDYEVALRWRIGPGGLLDRASVRAGESRERALEIQAEALREDVKAEVVSALEVVRSLAAQIEAMQRALAAAENLVRCTRDRREFGVGVVLEAVQAEQDLTRLRVDYLEALAAHNAAQFSLRRALGRLR